MCSGETDWLIWVVRALTALLRVRGVTDRFDACQLKKVSSMEANMRQATGQARQAGKRNVIVAGLGAAFVGSLLTFTIALGKPQPAAVPVAQPSAPGKTCQKVPLVWLVSSTAPGGGTVRLREGSYVSPPVKLTTRPQAVIFPGMRGDVAFEEPIVVQGDAQSIVMENLTHNFRRLYQLNNGTVTITTTWVPLTTCQIGTATIPVADQQ
jgi:hypothetical protein